MYYTVKRNFINFTNKFQISRDLYIKLNSFKSSILKFLNDETAAKKNYWEATSKKLNLKNPQSFIEKLWWLKINYRHPLMTQCSDKVRVSDYIKDIGLKHILTDIEGVYSKAEDIPFEKLDGKFFIKCNHVSGTNAIYDSNKPDTFNYSKFVKEFNFALSKNYYHQSREWNYNNNGEIKFGEVTFYTGGGTKQFSSEEADQIVASWIKL